MSARDTALIDVFATLVLLFVVTVQTWTLFDKVRGTYNDNVLTYDLHMPTWPFFAVAWVGDVSAVLLIAIRTYRLIFHPEEMHDAKDQDGGVGGMSTDAVAVLGFVALFALMLLRVPVGMAMGLVGVSGFGYLVGAAPALKLVGQTSMRTVTDYTFGVIPMFLLMGAFVSNSGMSRELFRAANAFVGHLRGGLGIATVAACGGFAAICGSSVATAATFSAVAYPEMRRFGYPQSFATGVIAAGGTLGAMLPPSTVLAVYGIITEQDIGKLFIAGIIPGLLAMTMYMLTIAIIGWFRPGLPADGPQTTWRERLAGLKDVWAPLLLFVFVIGGLYGGFPLHADRGRRRRRRRRLPHRRAHRAAGQGEDPALAAAGDAHRGRGVHRADRRADLRLLPDRDADAAEAHRVPHRPRHRPLRRAGADHGDVPGARLPDGRHGDDHPDRADHLPGDHALGFDPIWFGVIIVMTVELGLIHPPVGMNVFVIKSVVKDVIFSTIFKGVLPFVVTDLIRLVILIAFPLLATWLPQRMMAN